MLHLLGDDGEAVRQHLAANIANFFDHDVVSCSAGPSRGVLLWIRCKSWAKDVKEYCYILGNIACVLMVEFIKRL